MEQCEENSQENDDVIIEKEISKLIGKKYELAAVFNIVKALLNFLNHRVCSCLYFSGELPKYSRKL